MSDMTEKQAQSEDSRFLAGSQSRCRAVMTTQKGLRSLPTTARSIVDAADVKVPEGYKVEAVMAGLSFPCGMTVADDGTVFIAEGGTTWPTRPCMPSRLLRMNTDGTVRVIARETEGGLRGIAWRDGQNLRDGQRRLHIPAAAFRRSDWRAHGADQQSAGRRVA